MDWIALSKTHQEEVNDLVRLLLLGHRRSLSRCISMVESHNFQQRLLGQRVLEQARQARLQCAVRIGFSGAPGAGKSTLINGLGAEIVRQGHRLAVLTVDPSSAIKGGSLLGDAIRMDAIAHHDNVFIRSTPSGHNSGGVAKATTSTIELCEAAGYTIIMVESLGSGQVEFELAHSVDLYYWLTIPGAGDDLQAMKQGVLEWVDGIIITQADRGREQLALESHHAYQQGLQLYDSAIDVVTLSSFDTDAVGQLWQTYQKNHAALVDFDFVSNVDQPVAQPLFELAVHALQQRRAERAQQLNAVPLHGTSIFYFEAFDQLISRLRFQFSYDIRSSVDCLPDLVKIFGLDGAEVSWNGHALHYGAQLSVAERSRLSLSLPIDLLCQSDEGQFWSADRQLPLDSVVFIPLSVMSGAVKGDEFTTISNTAFQFLLGYRFLQSDDRSLADRLSLPCDIIRQWARAIQGVFFEMELRTLQHVIRPKTSGRVDGLTGIANRSCFRDHLEQILVTARRKTLPDGTVSHESIYVFAVDLDGFRQVNEVLGLAEGDRLLQLVSQALLKLMSPDDVIARFGGDEFFMCKVLKSRDAITTFGQSIQRALESVVNSTETQVPRLQCHIGCVPLADLFGDTSKNSKNTYDANEVLRAAGAALFAAKSMGLYSVFMYDVQLKAQAREIFMIKNELFQALAQDQFSYLAQPLFDHKTQLYFGAELLLRWNHPSRGVLPASEFIESADGLGIVQESDLRLIFKHLDQVLHIAKKYAVIFHLNLSAQLFFGQEIIDFAIALDERGALPYLHFEITEHAFIDRMVLLQQFIALVKAGGSQVWLDDFGIGYSGMRYLDQLNVDGVKIDQSFVRRIDQQRTRTLFKGMVHLVSNLHLSVLAEGVESHMQADLLDKLGCRYQQGLLHGTAKPLDEFVQLLEKQKQTLPISS